MPQKSWAVGEEVLAADFNSYIQNQVVPVFASTALRDSQWISPPNGALCVVTATNNVYERVSSSWYTPLCALGHVERTTDAGPQGPEAAVSGLSLTITVPSNRRVRLEHGVSRINTGSASGVAILRIKEGATVIYETQYPANASFAGPGGTSGRVITPSGATHTYFLTLEGFGATATIAAGATYPFWFEARDVGGV